MKTFMKYAAVGIAGYLLGFYEYKYKMMKAIATINIEELKDSKKKSK